MTSTATESLQAISQRADALKQRGDLAAALSVYEEAAHAWPDSAVAQHNLASTLGDLGRYDESAQAAMAAIKLGIRAPETRLVLARAHMNAGRLTAAQLAYREAVSLRPDMVVALQELTQLLWMSSADKNLALQPLVQAVQAYPMSAELHLALSQALEFTGDKEGAIRVILDLASRNAADALMMARTADLLLETGKLAHGRELAIRAFNADRSSFPALMTLARAALSCGEADGASAAITEALNRRPDDQHVLAMQAMVWRMTGNAGFNALYDYSSMVRSYLIEPPAGWSTRDDYLANLAEELKAAHHYRTHPFGHSVRQGSQLPNIFAVKTPAIQAFHQALQAPVNTHIEHLGTGPDPLRRRNTGAWQIQGIWSVMLRPGGFHVDHVHQEGWLSSAFYVELPDVVTKNNAKEGWIRFGQPGSPVQPAQAAQHFVKPEPGMLVLFPSYMWHGTVPFSGQQSRLTVAMDIIPG
ncbi:tetratricopeptide repeat protein [Gammaproteobacteria bacterium LSUCC0112]|nr:tetratricopeptide repeat protein [Gammaproteobacteria bacterium LSUCC0112]